MSEFYKSPWMTVNLSEKKQAATLEIDGVIGFFDWDADTLEEAKRLTKRAIKAELKALAELNTKRITVNINSPGGSTDHALAIHDLLCEHPAKIITRVYGQTASAATIIAQAADKGCRKVSENATYLVHKCMSCICGFFNANDLAEIIDDQNKITERLAALYAKRSGTDVEKIAELMDAQNGKGRWLSPEEALAFGLVDEIYEPTPTISLWSPEIMNLCMLPPLPEPQTEQKALPSDSANLAEPKPEPKEPKMALEKTQLATLKARFGAEFALSAVEGEMDYAAALEGGAELLATRVTEQAETINKRDEEIATLKQSVVDLEAKTQGLTDPLAASEEPEKKPEEKAMTFDEEFAAMVKDGKNPVEAYAALRETRSEEYAAKFGME